MLESMSVFKINKPFHLVQRDALVVQLDREVLPLNRVLCGLYLGFGSQSRIQIHNFQPAQTQTQTQKGSLLGGKLETFRR